MRSILNFLYRLTKYRIVNLYDFAYSRRQRRIENLKRFQRRHGFSIVPVSYFEPIPDLRDVDIHDRSLSKQIELNFEFGPDFIIDALKEAQSLELDLAGLAANEMYLGNDAIAYFGMIRRFKPRAIIEIGSGHSALLAERVVRTLKLDTHIVSIEPFPIPELSRLAAAAANVDLYQVRVEEIDQSMLARISELSSGDILFIDTSHVSVRGGDTNFIFCQILPRLKSGVVVHIHDMYLPYDYDRGLYYGSGRFYSEQYFLAAILSNSDRFEPLLSIYKCVVEDQAGLLPSRQGSGFWLRRQ